MPKPLKMLRDIDAPDLRSLMALIETQSKETVANGCIGYCGGNILPIYEKLYPENKRPRHAFAAVRFTRGLFFHVFRRKDSARPPSAMLPPALKHPESVHLPSPGALF